nr:universal stress protein [uncultured Carboxylicivirga sp.]
MKKKIIEFIQTTENIEEATKALVKLGNKLDKDLELILVSDPSMVSIPTGMNPVPSMEEANQFYQYLETQENKAKEVIDNLKALTRDVFINLKVQTGTLDHLVEQKSKEQDTYMIVLADDNYRQDISLITFFDKFSQVAECPILRLPGDYHYQPFTKILYASNFLEVDIPKLQKLTSIAEVFNAKVTLLHIATADEIEKFDTINVGKEILDKVNYNKLVVRTIKASDITDGINNYATQNGYDLVAVLREKKDFFENLFNKSQAIEISSKSDKPVLMFYE